MEITTHTEADYGMTEMAMRGQEARYAGDKSLYVSFDIIAMLNEQRTEDEGRPMYDSVPHIRIMVPGNKESIVIRPVTEMDKARFRKQWEDWQSTGAVTLEGTPLEMWTWISKAQVEELKFFNVRTVQQLADMADAHAQKFMGVNELRRKARIWLEQADKNRGTAKLAAELKERDNKIATMETALRELQDTVRAQKLQLEQFSSPVAPSPKKRGRPSTS